MLSRKPVNKRLLDLMADTIPSQYWKHFKRCHTVEEVEQLQNRARSKFDQGIKEGWTEKQLEFYQEILDWAPTVKQLLEQN